MTSATGPGPVEGGVAEEVVVEAAVEEVKG